MTTKHPPTETGVSPMANAIHHLRNLQPELSQ